MHYERGFSQKFLDLEEGGTMPHTLDSAVYNINENTNQCHDDIVTLIKIEINNLKTMIATLENEINNLQSSIQYIQSKLQ